MAEYTIADDGKLHTRYTELQRCGSYESALKIVKEKLEQKPGVSTKDLRFGGINHELFEEESRQTGYLPECFGIKKRVEHIEQEFAVEIVPGVVVHFRPDSVSEVSKTVFDYKTMNHTEGMNVDKEIKKKYKGAAQLKIYSYLLMVHGIDITHFNYLIELWDKQKMEIVGYRQYKQEFSLTEIPKTKKWITDRAILLQLAWKKLK